MTFNNITPFPSLFAENLIIRGIEQGDLDVVLHYFQKNRAYLTPWEPLKTENFFSREGWEKRLIPLLELQRHGLSYYFLIFEQGSEDVVGVISYNNILQYPFHSSQVGYSLAQNAQGRGIMRRALKKTNAWIFEHLKLHRIMASYMPRNKRSAGVLKAAGFKTEGKAKDYLLINGRWEDHILTSLINDVWSDECGV